MERKSYQEWERERTVYCRACSLPFENVREYYSSVHTVVDSRLSQKWRDEGCPRCGQMAGWISGFEMKFAIEEDSGSFKFKADGIAQLREEQKDRGGQLPEWSWMGFSEWIHECILLAKACELICKGYELGNKDLEEFVVEAETVEVE